MKASSSLTAAQYRGLALQALQSGEAEQAAELLRKATSLEPDNVGLLHDLAECQWADYQFDPALESYEAALRIASEPVATCVAAAKRLFGIGGFGESARWLQRAVTHSRRNAALLTMLAEVCERGNQLDDAERRGSEALALEPANVKAVRLMAHIERRRGQLDAARERLASHLARFPGSDDWRLRHELAAVLDRLGEYDAAMRELLLAKEQLQSVAAPALAQARAICRRQTEVAQLLGREDYEAWRNTRTAFTREVPIAFLCGHPRSGTTLLEQILDAHEGAIGTDETGILAREFIEPLVRSPSSAAESVAALREFDAGQIAQGRAAYLRFTGAHLGEEVGSRVLVEKDPMLTPDLPLPLRLFPEGKIIFPLRDPRDVCVSYFFTLLPLGASSAAAIDLRSTCEFCAHSLAMWAHWKNALPFPWLEVRYEALVTEPGRETRRLMAFLNLPWHEQLLAFHERARTKEIRTPTYADAGQPLYQRAVGRWKNYEKYLAPHMDVLRPHLREFGYE